MAIRRRRRPAIPIPVTGMLRCVGLWPFAGKGGLSSEGRLRRVGLRGPLQGAAKSGRFRMKRPRSPPAFSGRASPDLSAFGGKYIFTSRSAYGRTEAERETCRLWRQVSRAKGGEYRANQLTPRFAFDEKQIGALVTKYRMAFSQRQRVLFAAINVRFA